MYRPSNTTVESVLSQVSQNLNQGTPPAPPVAQSAVAEAAAAAPAEPNPLQEELETTRRELADSRSKSKTTTVRHALLDAAAKANVIDPSVAVELLQKYVRVGDNGELQVISDAGTPRLSANFEPLGIDGLLREFSESKPYLIKSTLLGGSGSSYNQRTYVAEPPMSEFFGAKSNSKSAFELFKCDPNSYHQMKIRAKAAGLID